MERIIVDSISKQFSVSAKNNTALEGAVNFFSRQARRTSWALKDVSFTAKDGENIGIIGRNGCGKSTLLRAVAGIYTVDSGSIKTEGKVVYLDGLAPGLKRKLTVKENIYLMGSLLSLGYKDIKSKFDTIIEFAGAEEFVDTKVFQLSSGMVARFAFSATINFVKYHNPDIILLDEVFGAGADAYFQKKAFYRMEELVRSGVTVLFASHNLDLIKRYCYKVLWMDMGKIVREGVPQGVCDAYDTSVLKNGGSAKV